MSISQLIANHTKELLAALSVVATWYLNSRFRPRARLVRDVRHASNILINEPTFDDEGNVIGQTKPAQHLQNLRHGLCQDFIQAQRNIEIEAWVTRQIGERVDA